MVASGELTEDRIEGYGFIVLRIAVVLSRRNTC